MPDTSHYGFTYPAPGDHTRTWEYWQKQAEQTEQILRALTDYSVVTTPGTGVSNWQGASTLVRAQRVGPLVALTLVFERQNFTMQADTDYTVFTLSEEWRPLAPVYTTLIVNTNRAPTGRFTIATNGDIVARTTVLAAIGAQIQGSVVYAAPFTIPQAT